MAGKPTLTVKLQITGVRQTLAAFNRLPKEASQILRARTLELAQTLAAQTQTAARADSRQSALMAPTVKASKDRVPAITAGGTKRVGRNRVPAYKILFGSEFGSNSLPQFRPHRGAASYWFFTSVQDDQSRLDAAWNKVATEILDGFAGGP